MGCGSSKNVQRVARIGEEETEQKSVQQAEVKPAVAALIDGKAVADGILENLRTTVDTLGAEPLLAVVLVGSNPASMSYIKRKQAAAAGCGIRTKLLHLDDSVSQLELQRTIETLDADDDTDGIILQLPLPEHLDAKKASALISLAKDVDGFSPCERRRNRPTWPRARLLPVHA